MADATAPNVPERLDACARLARLVHDVANLVNVAPSAADAFRTCLPSVCDAGDFSYGGVFVRENDALVPSPVWHAADPERVRAFVEVTAHTRFAPGIGGPGRAMAAGHPVWTGDAHHDLARGAAARKAGLCGNVEVPVLVGVHTAAVIELYAEHAIEPSAALLEALACAGAMLGRAIERDRHARALEELALSDPLTGVHTTRSFALLASHQLKVAARMDRTPTLLVVDVIGMSDIVARFGRDEGDRALKETATLLKRGFRESDVVGRIGASAFAVFAVDTNLNQSDALRERIRRAADTLNASRTRRYPLLLAVGTAVFDPRRPQTIEHFVEAARTTLAEPKRPPSSGVLPAHGAVEVAFKREPSR
jgi:diguanylate cyclase (GGDEF)-like protein